MDLLGRILAVLPAALAVYAALRLLLRLRRDRTLGGTSLALLALQAPLSLIGYLALLRVHLASTPIVLWTLGGLVLGTAAAAVVTVVLAGRRRAVRRAGWIPLPTALAVATVQIAAVLGDMSTLRVALGALAAAGGLGLGAAGGALVRLLRSHPAPQVHTRLAPAPDALAVLAGLLAGGDGPAAIHARTRPDCARGAARTRPDCSRPDCARPDCSRPDCARPDCARGALAGRSGAGAATPWSGPADRTGGRSRGRGRCRDHGRRVAPPRPGQRAGAAHPHEHSRAHAHDHPCGHLHGHHRLATGCRGRGARPTDRDRLDGARR